MTNVPRWKYDAVRAAILDTLSTVGEGGFAFADLRDAVGTRLDEDTRARLGSLGWHVTVVKLNMEVEGEIRRIPRVTPQRIALV